MSEPKKYEYVSDGYTARFINPKTGHSAPYGEYVRWEDYARLKAEVERLTAFTTRTIIPNEELQKQVERLTKAGDKLHAFLINYIVESRISSAHLNKLDDGWNAAKEGKQP